jgi:hypothetical protein
MAQAHSHDRRHVPRGTGVGRRLIRGECRPRFRFGKEVVSRDGPTAHPRARKPEVDAPSPGAVPAVPVRNRVGPRAVCAGVSVCQGEVWPSEEGTHRRTRELPGQGCGRLSPGGAVQGVLFLVRGISSAACPLGRGGNVYASARRRHKREKEANGEKTNALDHEN